jgi:DNA-binding beta-propeller fold protein YncE
MFPDIQLTRRELLAAGSAVALLAPVPSLLSKPGDRTIIGTGDCRYEVVDGWGMYPGTFGWGVGIVCDSRDRIYVHTRSKKSVVVFDRNGTHLNDFGAEFAESGHGLYWHKEGRDEFLFFCDHNRNLVVKTDLRGNSVLRFGNLSSTSTTSIRFDLNQPTDLAIAPNGDIYVAEGYGGNRVQVFARNGKHLRTIGGPGSAPGRFNCPHGIWVDTRKREPELYIADRSNQRIQILSLDGTFKRSVSGVTRLPNCFYEHGGQMFIPDLDRRVTVLDEQDRLVAHLGDGRDLPIGHPTAFDAPHAVCVDSHGDLYVIEWTESARVRKFNRCA